MMPCRSIHESDCPAYLPTTSVEGRNLEVLKFEDIKEWRKTGMNTYLNALSTLPNDDWIATKGVKPCLIRTTDRCDNAVIFDPDMRQMTYESGEVRRRGGKYVFSNDAKHYPSTCYVVGGLKIYPVLRKEYTRLPTIHEATPLVRPENTDCSVCLETLTGQRLINCPNNHQIHTACYNNFTYFNKRCPECRSGYTTEETIRASGDPTKINMRTLYTLPNLNEREAEHMFSHNVRTALNTQYTGVGDKGGHLRPECIVVSDSIHRYVKKTHSPFFIRRSGLLTYEPINATSECWTQFIEYINSDENRAVLLETDWSVGNDYTEQMFLTALTALFGSEALPTLTATSADYNLRTRLRRQVYLNHAVERLSYTRVLGEINDFYFRKIKHGSECLSEEVEVSA